MKKLRLSSHIRARRERNGYRWKMCWNPHRERFDVFHDGMLVRAFDAHRQAAVNFPDGELMAISGCKSSGGGVAAGFMPVDWWPVVQVADEAR